MLAFNFTLNTNHKLGGSLIKKIRHKMNHVEFKVIEIVQFYSKGSLHLKIQAQI